MPQLVEGTEPAGRLKAALAAEWGMGEGVVVAGGAGDNAASACGMGTIGEGHAFVSLGTSGVLFAANARYLPNPESAVHAFCHALPNTWHQMGVILSATDALNWHAGVTGRSAAELTAELGEGLKAPTGVTFLPYLSGERTPHNDAAIRAVFAERLDRSSGLATVQVAAVVREQAAPIKQHEPDHPLADEEGNVWVSPVDENAEMVEMLEASRQYQNLVEAVSTARQLMLDTMRNR